MEKIALDRVTLLGIDCIDIERLLFVSEISQKHIRFGQVKLLTSLPCNAANIVRISPIKSREQYSLFMMKELYKYIDTEYVLIIQWDGFVLNPSAWRTEFLAYDYIGAPWHFEDGYNVGNGGFSLRSRRLMERVAVDKVIDQYHAEDDMICRRYGRYLKMQGYTFAPDEVARQFSTEMKWEGQFGFHKTDISNWDIDQFVDGVTHAKYVGLFKHYFGNEAENYHNLNPGAIGL